jgi:hypothetical protein
MQGAYVAATVVLCGQALSQSGCGPGADDAALWPMPALPLPSMSCLPLPPSAGECARSADCGASERCVLAEPEAANDRGPLMLTCGPPRASAAEGDACERGETCSSGLCSLAGSCVEPCAEDADCQLGQACQSLEVRIPMGLAPLAGCARVAAFAADVALSLDQGQTLRAGKTNRIELASHGEDALYFLKAECGTTLQVQSVREQVSGRSIFDLTAQLNGVVQPNPVVQSGALVPLLIPNNPRLSLHEGGYMVELASDADSPLSLITASRAAPKHILDVHVFYVGGGSSLEDGGLHPGSPAFGEVLDRLAARYSALGVTLGVVHEYEVVGALREQLADIDLQSALGGSGQSVSEVEGLARLFSLSTGLNGGGVSLFLVRSLGPLFAVSSGTPGALGLLGTPLQGVAVALDRFPLEQADRVLFHELGHQFGLFHTTEADGSVYEPLSDTPQCELARDADGDGILTADECVAAGADNLMFWEGEGEALTPQQIAVITHSLVLR